MPELEASVKNIEVRMRQRSFLNRTPFITYWIITSQISNSKIQLSSKEAQPVLVVYRDFLSTFIQVIDSGVIMETLIILLMNYSSFLKWVPLSYLNLIITKVNWNPLFNSSAIDILLEFIPQSKIFFISEGEPSPLNF